MLSLSKLHKRLGGTMAVDNCSLLAQAGERLVLTGPNGAGKSTLLKIVAGVLSPDRGSICYNGHELIGKARRVLGYVPEAANPPGLLRIDELLHFIAATKECPPLKASVLQRLNLELLLGAHISELSLGERRRVCLAAALVGNPRLLLLDEPTNGLDASSITVLADLLLGDSERIVLMATHDRKFAQRIQTRSVLMKAGKIQ